MADSLRRAPPPVLKLIAPTAHNPVAAAEWRSRRPDGLLVLRHHFADEGLDRGKFGPTLALADAYRDLRPVVECPVNEAHQTSPADLARLAQYTLAWLEAAAAKGHASAVGVFSEGNPADLAWWEAFHPTLRAARALWLDGGPAVYLALHEYWTPGARFDTWHSVRYRRVWAALPEDCRLPILITECGIDGGINAPDGNRKEVGWKGYLDAERYAADLREYRALLEQDDYVHGATVFVHGCYPQWEKFDTLGEPLLESVYTERRPATPFWSPTAGAGTEEPPVEPANPWRGKILTVWQLPERGGPPRPEALTGWAERLGLDGFELKVGDGGSAWGQSRHVTRAYVDALKAGGKYRVLGWTYNYCDLRRNAGDRGDGVPELEAEVAAERLTALGLEGHTFDLEIESEGHADLVEIMLSRFRQLRPAVPLGVHTWAYRSGHERYAWDAIKRHADVLRPMIYRPTWNAPQSWAELGDWYAGSVVCPVWGITEGTAAGLRADHEFALARGCPGVALWEYTALPGKSGVEPLVRSWSFGAPPAPEPEPEPGDPVQALRDRTWALADEWEQLGYPWHGRGIKAVVAVGKGDR